jgi:hypothetical protein
VNYAVEMASGVLTYIPDFMKIATGVKIMKFFQRFEVTMLVLLIRGIHEVCLQVASCGIICLGCLTAVGS